MNDLLPVSNPGLAGNGQNASNYNPVSKDNPVNKENPAGSETLELEVKELKGKLSSIEEKVDSIAKLLAELSESKISDAGRELILPEESKSEPVRNENAQREIISTEDRINGRKIDNSKQSENIQSQDKTNEREIDNSKQREIIQAQDRINSAPGVNDAAAEIILHKESSINRNGEILTKQDPLAAGNDVNKAGLEAFGRFWNSMSRHERTEAKTTRVFIDFVKKYPSLNLPGTERIKKQVSQHGIEVLEMAERLRDIIKAKLGKEYPCNSFAIAATRFLILLSEAKITKGNEFRTSTGIPGGQFYKISHTLQSLGFMNSLFGKKYHCYVITEAGKAFLSGK